MDILMNPLHCATSRWFVFLFLALALTATGHAGDTAPDAAAVQELGDGRYRVGSIEVNKTERSFRVPGVVIQLEPEDAPIEFLAVTKGGRKRYEAIFELDTSAVEFNLACILIGLDAKQARLPEFHFDPKPAQGDPVAVFVSWQRDGKVQRVTGEEAVSTGQPSAAANDWVYTGSSFDSNGNYMAEEVGTLVGFVHDMDSIIQHRQGLGLGHYGALKYNPALLPPPGTAVTLSVQRRAE